MLRYRRLVLPALFLLTGSNCAIAASEPSLESWMEVMDAPRATALRIPGVHIGDSLFDWLDELKLFDLNLWDGGPRVGLRSQRKVYDNQDILNSWTVIDRLRLETKVPIAQVALPQFPLQFNIGIGNAIDLVDIRQILPAHYASLPEIHERQAELAQAVGTDPQDTARFGNLLNRIAFPLRLSHMEPGEVISYSGEGSIELGTGAGWRIDGGPVGEAWAGATVQTYLKGVFRISVLKESDRYSRVKLTRLGVSGSSASIGAGFDPSLVSGLIVLNVPGSLVRKTDPFLKVTPFEFSASRDSTRSFDVSYRYDLESPVAKDAYEQALTGRFAASEGAEGVEKIHTRWGEGQGSGSHRGIRLGFIFGSDRNSGQRTLETRIVLPDGTINTFQAWVESRLEWQAFLMNYEKFRHRFTVRYEPDAPAPSAISLWAEGEIHDSFTRAGELLAYILEIENVVGLPGIFPRPPVHWGERSSFFYRLAFGADQIDHFLKTDPEAAWSLLEQAFKVRPGSWSTPWKRFWARTMGETLNILTYPLYLADVPLKMGNRIGHAMRIHRNWMKIRESSNPREVADRMMTLFNDRRYGVELVHLLRGALDGQTVAFQLSGFSPAFGRITREGNARLFADDVATRAQREADYDRESGRVPDMDGQSRIVALSSALLGGRSVRLDFELPVSPQAIYIELLETGNWGWRPKRIGMSLVQNSGQFHEGLNSIVLDPNDPLSLFSGLAAGLHAGGQFRVRMAVNPAGLGWGQVADHSFRL